MFSKLIVALLVLSVSCVPLSKYETVKSVCGNKYRILGFDGQCEYDIATNNLGDYKCGSDYYKSQVCESNFKDCLKCLPD